MSEALLDPHPLTGELFSSPVPPGTGWPGDAATTDTPVAHSAADVSALATSSQTVDDLDACITVCRPCPRLVEWRESVATTGRRASFADQPDPAPVPAAAEPWEQQRCSTARSSTEIWRDVIDRRAGDRVGREFIEANRALVKYVPT